MILEILAGLLLFSSLIIFSLIRSVFNSNSKKIELTTGSFPKETGRYYIILERNGKSIVTVDTYNADSMIWEHTKNPLNITYFAAL